MEQSCKNSMWFTVKWMFWASWLWGFMKDLEVLSDPGEWEVRKSVLVSVLKKKCDAEITTQNDKRFSWCMADTPRSFIPGEKFQKLTFQIYRTQLLSGHRSNRGIVLLLWPTQWQVTSPVLEFIKKCHRLGLETSVEGLVPYSQTGYWKFRSWNAKLHF